MNDSGTGGGTSWLRSGRALAAAGVVLLLVAVAVVVFLRRDGEPAPEATDTGVAPGAGDWAAPLRADGLPACGDDLTAGTVCLTGDDVSRTLCGEGGGDELAWRLCIGRTDDATVVAEADLPPATLLRIGGPGFGVADLRADASGAVPAGAGVADSEGGAAVTVATADGYVIGTLGSGATPPPETMEVSMFAGRDSGVAWELRRTEGPVDVLDRCPILSRRRPDSVTATTVCPTDEDDRIVAERTNQGGLDAVIGWLAADAEDPTPGAPGDLRITPPLGPTGSRIFIFLPDDDATEVTLTSDGDEVTLPPVPATP